MFLAITATKHDQEAFLTSQSGILKTDTGEAAPGQGYSCPFFLWPFLTRFLQSGQVYDPVETFAMIAAYLMTLTDFAAKKAQPRPFLVPERKITP